MSTTTTTDTGTETDTRIGTRTTLRQLSGNHACALGAVAAGCRFFAGYPITPSSEIAERLSRALPEVDGVFIQMEDEIASMAAVIGASMGGVKAMTATSGPGYSLKQENLGYAAGAEIPCVIVNVMRGGPSTGMPTRPAQGEIMQSRWGSHGDYPIVVLAPASAREIYTETQRAFELAERLRTPVVLLYDQSVAQLTETVELGTTTGGGTAGAAGAAGAAGERRWASGPRETWQPYAAGADGVPAMARPGDGYRVHTTGLTHAESGFPTQNPEAVERNLARLFGKLERNRALIDSCEALQCEDAEVLIVAIGICARAARRALEELRARGVRAGLFRPITLWPFPEAALRAAATHARAVLVPELNTGQLRLEVERLLGADRVHGLNRYDGEPITPAQIAARVGELAGTPS
jgi:2-oxoglutarate ferredoxin oxidoreductase subunit alpha